MSIDLDFTRYQHIISSTTGSIFDLCQWLQILLDANTITHRHLPQLFGLCQWLQILLDANTFHPRYQWASTWRVNGSRFY